MPLTRNMLIEIRKGSSLYLVLSPREFTKHYENIVERFCMDKGIEGSYDAKREKFTIADQEWQIVGGGKFERNTNKKPSSCTITRWPT